MSTTADDATGPSSDSETAEIRAAIAAASEGDEVRLAITNYEWTNPLAVDHVDDAAEWDAPFATDWWTRSIYVEGGNGALYELALVDIGDSPVRAECYRYADGDREIKRGDIESLTLVDDEGDEAGEDADGDAAPEHAVGDELPDDASEHDDDDDDDDESEESEVALPDDVTAEDVADAVDAHEEGGAADLGLVADELGLSPGRTRALVYHLGHIDRVREVVKRAGGRSR